VPISPSATMEIKPRLMRSVFILHSPLGGSGILPSPSGLTHASSQNKVP
jgi:hypothetical protein